MYCSFVAFGTWKSLFELMLQHKGLDKFLGKLMKIAYESVQL